MPVFAGPGQQPGRYGGRAFARRLARDTQLVLQDESYLHVVDDPAAGAGGFETLTQELCERAAEASGLGPREIFDAILQRERLGPTGVGDGIAIDFYREVAALVDPRTRALVLEVFEDTGHAGFVQDRVRAAIAARLMPGRSMKVVFGAGGAGGVAGLVLASFLASPACPAGVLSASSLAFSRVSATDFSSSLSGAMGEAVAAARLSA